MAGLNSATAFSRCSCRRGAMDSIAFCSAPSPFPLLNFPSISFLLPDELCRIVNGHADTVHPVFTRRLIWRPKFSRQLLLVADSTVLIAVCPGQGVEIQRRADCYCFSAKRLARIYS